MVLLHGFPEFWYSWRAQIRALAEEGFHVIASDMRGYNRSDKPEGLEAYTRPHLTGNVAQLIDHFDEGPAAVVGHDWGGVVSWIFAMDYAEYVARLTHPFFVIFAPPVRLLILIFIFLSPHPRITDSETEEHRNDATTELTDRP